LGERRRFGSQWRLSSSLPFACVLPEFLPCFDTAARS
jgi:hypothetical protein